VVRRFRSFLKILTTVAAIGLVLFLARSWWLTAMGRALVRDDGPAQADAMVVLAGDDYGNRILKAAELARAGYAHVILVSGPPGFYGNHECDLAIPFAVRHGYPEEWFVHAPNETHSTREEGAFLLGELRRRNARSFLLVTSNYHTGRASQIFTAEERATGYFPVMHVVAAPDRFFQPDSWWREREARKIAFNEWLKTIAWKLGI